MTEIKDRELTQVFVSECAVTKDEDGELFVSGKVEISVRGLDGQATGPTLSIDAGVSTVASTTLEEMPKLIIAKAMELVKRIAQEPVEKLIEMEAMPFDAKWTTVSGNDD